MSKKVIRHPAPFEPLKKDPNKPPSTFPPLLPGATPNLPALTKKHDLTSQEAERVQRYIEAGTPGVGSIDDNKLYRIMDLYLSGKTYHSISAAMSINKDMLMYLSYKFNWVTAREEYLNDQQYMVIERLREAKIRSTNFLVDLSYFYQQKIGRHINNFHRTGDIESAEKIDPKDVDKLLKVMDMHLKYSSEGRAAPASPVGLNMGENGVTITKSADGSVEITPREAYPTNFLKQYADMRREEEKKNNVAKLSDNSHNSIKGETNNEE